MSEEQLHHTSHEKSEPTDDAVYNIESYSEESGDPDTDPFKSHYGDLIREIFNAHERHNTNECN